MPTRWLFLCGAPSSRDVLSASESPSQRRHTGLGDSSQPAQSQQRWHTVFDNSRGPVSSVEGLKEVKQNVQDSQTQTSSSCEGDQAAILAALLEQSRDVAEESRSHMDSVGLAGTDRLNVPLERHGKAKGTHHPLERSEDSFSESLLPPPTQLRSRLGGDASKSYESFGNITEEQSLLNLPSWCFQLASLTPLNALPSSVGRGPFNSPRVNLLALVDEVELPSTMPVRNPSKGSKAEVTRAGMSLVDETGASLQIVMWDSYAEEWAGQLLLQGDVIYVESIALSAYKGQRQGTTVKGSKVQVCYRTVDRHNGRRTDPALRPQLDLDWDPISQKVKALAQLATNM